MPATIYNASSTNDFLTAIGGTITSGDSIILDNFENTFDTNVNQATKDVLLFKLGPNCRCNTAAGSRVAIDVDRTSAGQLICEFAGRLWAMQAGSGSGIFNYVYCRPTAGGVLDLAASTVTALDMAGGSFKAQSDCDVNLMRVFDGSWQLLGDASPATTNTLDVNGGAGLTRRITTTLNMRGGLLRADNYLATMGTINLHGGTLQYGAGAVGTKVWGYSGVLDYSILRRDLTVADAEFWERLTIINPPKGITVTYTTGPTLRGRGPKYIDL